MASFTDKISQFNPYIQQLPAQEMQQVGMYKQQQYDQGVQKIQSYIDNVAGMDILHEGQKGYLQSKMNDLGGKLKTVAAGDFSNSQLVNSVGGMATSIIKDPIIQNAVMSTQRIRQGMADKTAANKDGKGGPDNDWFFDTGVNSFMSNTDIKASYNGKYINKYDVDKDVQDAISKAHLSSEEWEESAKNPNGTINTDILLEKSKKGLLSGKVKSIVDAIYSKPEVQQQLAITGMYRYKDYDVNTLKAVQDESLAYTIKRAGELKLAMGVKSTVSSADGAKPSQAVVDIDNQVQAAQNKHDAYIKLLNEGKIEQARIALHKDEKEQQYINEFSWEENSMKSKVSPWFTASMTRANYNLAVQKENFDERMSLKNYDIAVEKLGIDKAELKIKQAIAEGKLNPDGSSKALYTLGAANPNEIAKVGSDSYQIKTKALQDETSQIQAKIISTLPGYEDLYIQDPRSGEWEFNYNKYRDWKTVEPKYRQALQELDKAHQNGTIKPNYQDDVTRLYDLQSLVAQNKQIIKSIDDKYKPAIDAVASQVTDPSTPYPGLITPTSTGKINNVPVSKTDIVQYWVSVNSKDPNAREAAAKYLEGKFPSSPGELYSGSKAMSSIFPKQYREVYNIMTKNPGIAAAFDNREKDYKNVQQQDQHYYATVNAVKTEDKLAVNKVFNNLLSNYIGGGKGSGKEFGEFAKMLDATKPDNLNNNLYDYWKGSDGQWYAQVRRNLGDGKYKYSEILPIKESDAKTQLGAKENPYEEAFDSKFGGFLDNFNGKQTAKSLLSPEAENTAIARRSVGKYSVGYHLKQLNGGYVPLAYIRDSNSGNVIASGLEVDFSVFSKDPRLTPQQKETFKNSQTIMSKEDVITKLPMLDENFYDLLLKNR
jgi:hypothetical protein